METEKEKMTLEPDPIPPDTIDTEISNREKVFWVMFYGFLIAHLVAALVWRAL